MPARLDGVLKQPRTPVFASVPWIAMGLGAMAILIHLFPTISRRLQYDRESIELHQFWRLLSCHGSHWSVEHLTWDALTFVLLGGVCERWSRRRFIAFLGVSGLVIPLFIHTALPGIASYRGLSGLDAGLLTLVLAMVVRAQVGTGRYGLVVVAVAAFVAFMAKVVLEFNNHRAVFVSWAGVEVMPLPVAHLLGAAVGLVIGFVGWPRVVGGTGHPIRLGSP